MREGANVIDQDRGQSKLMLIGKVKLCVAKKNLRYFVNNESVNQQQKPREVILGRGMSAVSFDRENKKF